MAIPKICGIETEYGISVRGGADFNPILTSSLLINAYAKPAFRRVKWDYEEENPLRDARGFERTGLGTLECPELFQLDLDGDPSKRTWVLAASANDLVRTGPP